MVACDFLWLFCRPVVFIVSNSYIHIIILRQFVFLCLFHRLMLSVFEFSFITIFLSSVLLSVLLSLFGHFVNFLTLKSVSPVFVLILKNPFIHFPVCLKISAKFSPLQYATSWIFTQEIQFLNIPGRSKTAKHEFVFIFIKEYELKHFSFNIN